jgi:hypothetical protein
MERSVIRDSTRAEKIPEFALLRPGYGFKKIAKAAALASNAWATTKGETP